MSMSIYEQLETLYDKSGYEKGSLQKDIEYYLRVGYIFSTPESFVMGRQIDAGWYIHAAVGVGAVESFLRYMPYYLPYVGWERRGGKTKWYPTDKLKRKLNHENAKSNTSDSSAASNE